ncbi:MAG: nucleotidyl transferase AbiEii/AbiGii toxin family protein [Armatimonadetes bacterium]|nr:nucleotidyl transferase AbiEii/AbiGii toxin family protein [Armatimonadota bacterium]
MLGSSLVEALRRGVEAFQELGIEYALVGGVAATVRGRLRSTRDCDVLVVASRQDLSALKAELRERGFSHLDRADRHVIEDVVLYRFWFPVEESGFSLSLDVQAGGSDYHREVVLRATAETFGAVELQVASREDLILLKLLAWRPIDRADAIDLAALGSPSLDHRYLHKRAEQLGIVHRLEELLREGQGEI